MELKKCKLGDLIDVTRGQSLSGEYYATEGKYIRLTCGNFDYNNNSFKENTSKDNLFFTGTIKPEFIMKKGDIITPLTEQAIGLLGSTAMIPESDKYIQSQDVAKIICKENKLDHDFAYYLISSKLVKEQLSAAAQQTKIRHTSPDKIKDCTVWIPDIVVQRRIASVLSALDRKISLNRSINAELERMAKEVYDYWFVQFEFPDANGRPYKSSGGAMVYNPVLKREVPQGWEVVNVFDGCDVQYGFPFSTELFTEDQTDIPVIRIRDILDGSISAYSYEEVDPKYKLSKGDLLIGMDGNFHMNYWHRNTDYLNQRSVRIRTNKNTDLSIIQVRYAIAPFIKAKEKNAKGSTVGHLSDKDMKELHVIIPQKNKHFNPKLVLDNLLNEILANRNSIEELTHLRDELLPLLMTGQVKIK